MSIGRFLITAGTEALDQILSGNPWLNPIERRGDTVFVTAFLDLHHIDELIASCRQYGVTLQRRDERAKAAPYWLTLYQGELPEWKP